MGMIFSRMIFSHGFVHCDPHPGNVLINPVASTNNNEKNQEFQIVLLDHGLYQVWPITRLYFIFEIFLFFVCLNLERIWQKLFAITTHTYGWPCWRKTWKNSPNSLFISMCPTSMVFLLVLLVDVHGTQSAKALTKQHLLKKK